MHTHHCKVCGEALGVCADRSCETTKEHVNQGDDANFCGIHHPDPKKRAAPTPPVARFAVLVKPEEAKA